MIMKKAFSTLFAVAVLAASFAVLANASTFAQGKKMTPLQEMLGQLNLSEEQKKKIEPVLAKQAEAQKALRADTTLAEDARKAKNQEISKATNTALREILTSEQWEKLKELRKARAQQQQGNQQKKP
jgi:Spy/CpxP family protein refolding chaperone